MKTLTILLSAILLSVSGYAQYCDPKLDNTLKNLVLKEKTTYLKDFNVELHNTDIQKFTMILSKGVEYKIYWIASKDYTGIASIEVSDETVVPVALLKVNSSEEFSSKNFTVNKTTAYHIIVKSIDGKPICGKLVIAFVREVAVN